MPTLQPETAYLEEVAATLARILGSELVGVYAGGSYALGDYDAGRSDLDVSAVTRSAVAPKAKDAIVAALRHETLPCPARGLELVVYRAEAAASGAPEPAFELNLNTGAGLPFRADAEPVAGEEHWFPIDRSVLA